MFNFIDKKSNKEIGLKDFFGAIGVKASDEFFQRLGDYFTFFIYNQSQGNRIGFAVKINDYTGFEAIMKKEELFLEEKYAPFFSLLTADFLQKNKIFKNASAIKSYTGPNFRYKILTNRDVGFYYLPSSQNYFVFTTSWASMEKTIGKLGITENLSK